MSILNELVKNNKPCKESKSNEIWVCTVLPEIAQMHYNINKEEYSCVGLSDLPDEILIIIFQKLNNLSVFYS